MAAESTVRILFLGDSAQAVRSVSRLESSFGSLHRTTKLLAGGLAIGLVGGLVEATKQALDFQRSMELIHTQAGASQGEVKKMSTALLGMAKAVGTTPEDLSKGLYHIESAGIRSGAALKVLKAAAEGAKVGQADLETTTNALVAAQTSGIKGAGSMEHAMAVLNATVGAGNMRMQDLAGAIGNVLPSASTFGVSIQQLGAAISTMTVQGVNADEAATRLRMTFSLLAAPTSKATAAFKEIGLSQNDLANAMQGPGGLLGALKLLEDHLKNSGKTAVEQNQIISAAFGGGRSSSAILLLLHHIDDMQGRLEQINRTTGNFKNAWEDTTQTVAFKLEQAKAALEAAAIPVGNLLLPLLIKAANAAGSFASQIEGHMPQITADFQAFGGVLRTAGSALQGLTDIALSPVGSATLLGLLSGVGAAKVIGGLSNLAIKAGESSIALTGVGVAGTEMAAMATPVAIGIGVLAGALIASAQAGDSASVSLRNVTDALNGLTGAAQNAVDAGDALKQAHIDVRTSAIAVRDAERSYAQAVRQNGANSEAARKAELALQQARLDHRRALEQEQSATRANSQAQAQQRAEIQKQKDALDQAANSYRSLAHFMTSGPRGPNLHPNEQDAGQVRKFADAMGQVHDKAVQAAGVIPNSDRAAQNAAHHLAAAAQAAKELAIELGRIPTQKEINIRIQIDRFVNSLTGGPGFGRFATGRAGGGFIPSVPGSSPGVDSVPAMLTPGEVVLNREQQNVLGGPRFLAGLFGFTGEEGPGFASGGIAKGPKKSPHHPRAPRVKTTSKKAKAMLKAVDAVNQQEADTDRAYGQLVRQYQIADTDLQFIRTDPNGNPYISQPDIDQRVGEIDSLIVARNGMLALLAEEKKKLEEAIKALKAAVEAMIARIQQERKNIEALTKEINAERKKKKPNTNRIAALQQQITNKKASISTLHADISSFQHAIGDQRLNLVHQLPFDVRDVQLDIMELQQERKDDVGTTLPPGSGGGGGGTSSDQQALITFLEAELAQANLALGIQTTQSGIIGSFAKGTLSVPETGLALVHAGETIRPAAWHGSSDRSTQPSPIAVNLTLSGPLEPLAQFITATVDTPAMADRISVRMGRAASARARSGRH